MVTAWPATVSDGDDGDAADVLGLHRDAAGLLHRLAVGVRRVAAGKLVSYPVLVLRRACMHSTTMLALFQPGGKNKQILLLTEAGSKRSCLKLAFTFSRLQQRYYHVRPVAGR